MDDEPYGGGAGMVLRVEPFVQCLESIQNNPVFEHSKKGRVLMTAADGRLYNQSFARELASEEHLIILCGHFKGIDERVSKWVDDKISIGDFVLSGGEIPAMVIVDSIARLLPGVVSDRASVETDSHYNGLLGAPCYTRPPEFRGETVPDILRSGHTRKIEEYQFLESVKRTAETRPDLLDQYQFSKEEKKLLKKYGLEELCQVPTKTR